MENEERDRVYRFRIRITSEDMEVGMKERKRCFSSFSSENCHEKRGDCNSNFQFKEREMEEERELN